MCEGVCGMCEGVREECVREGACEGVRMLGVICECPHLTQDWFMGVTTALEAKEEKTT